MNNNEEFISPEQCMKEFIDAKCASAIIPIQTIQLCFEQNGGLTKFELNALMRACAPNNIKK